MKNSNGSTRRTYVSRFGRLSLRDAQLVGDTIEILRQRLQRRVRPADFVAYSKPHRSPTHRLFRRNWNSHFAAQSWWEKIARDLMDDVGIEFRISDNVTEVIGAFQFVEGLGPEGHDSIDRIMNEKEAYQYLLAQAMQEIKSWTHKYRNLHTLKPLIKAIYKFKLKQN